MVNLKAWKHEQTGRWHLEGRVEPDDVTFNSFVYMLHNRINFKFSRFGDGEFNAITGKIGTNCDGHEYFPDLGAELNRVLLSSPDYFVGIQPLTVSLNKTEINILIEAAGIEWLNADVLHNASIDGKLHEFLAALQDRQVIIVGPDHLMSFKPQSAYIIIPPVNCWKAYESTCKQIEFHLAGMTNAVVLLCASMMSEVIIDRFKDVDHTFIDCGSVFDPYFNVKSRKYHHKLDI